jgi:hypothetical protein
MAMAFVIVIYGTPVVTGVTDPKDLMGSWADNSQCIQKNKQTKYNDKPNI